jgi:hypothetical protein
MRSGEAQRAQNDRRQSPAKPFTRLLRHSIERVMNGGDESGELDFGIGAMLALLAALGVFASVVASQSDEYFFIVLAMVAAGAVAIWKWEALIPGRRDYVNLAPLPIPATHILYANLAALLLVAAALGFDVNVASSVLFPLVTVGSHSSFGYLALLFATHLLSVFLASVFSFFIVLAVLGLMMVLPYRAFRRCSVYVRCCMVAFLMAMLSTSFEMSAIVQHPSATSRPLVQLLPPVWFLGLCQHLRGLADPAFGTLTKTAILACVASLALAIAAYALSYRRCFKKSLESIENFAAVDGAIRHRRGHRARDLFLRTPFERGGFSFTLKTLSRSEKHKLVVGGFVGVGIVLASEAMFQSASASGSNRWPSAELLSIPLIVLYLLLIGLRYSFEIPVMQKANWIFRVGTNPDASECVGLARKIMLTFLIPPLFAIVLPAYGFLWGWRVGAIHTAVVAAASMLLIEILLVRFRKIPFTCATPHFKSNFPVSVFFYFVGFVVFTSFFPSIERRAFDDPRWYLGFTLGLVGIWVGLALYRRQMNGLDHGPIFEERSDVGDVVIEVLNLSWIAREVADGGTGDGIRATEWT